LRSSFDAQANTYPNLKHVLIDTPTHEARDYAQRVTLSVFRRTTERIWYFSNPSDRYHVFFDNDFSIGKAAYECFWQLAEDVIATLAAAGLFQPTGEPPDTSEPGGFVAKNNHYAAQWVLFIHQFAKERPGTMPRSASAPSLENFALKAGGMAHTLTPGVFKASSLVIEQVLSEDAKPARQAVLPEGELTTADRVPSLDELVQVHQALWVFILWNRYSAGSTWQQEYEYRPYFEGLADALRPIRLKIDRIEGWEPRVERALRVIVKTFDETARLWGWERLASAEPERSAFLAERRAWVRENLCRPMYEAACSWQAGCQDLECPRDVDDVADEGRRFGFKPTMTLDEGKARYSAACKTWDKSPRLGLCYPRIPDEQEEKFNPAFNMLRAIVHPLAPERTNRPPWRQDAAPQPETAPILIAQSGMNRRPNADESPSNAAAPVPYGPWITPQPGQSPAADPVEPPRENDQTASPAAPALTELPDLVTLDQAAAHVHKTKRALEYYKTKGKLPEPYAEGGAGKAALYDWRILGPWLTNQFGIPLPDKFPRPRKPDRNT
jgi:hypothetical protein